MNKAVLIATKQLTKEYGELTAVGDLSFQVHEGEVVGFVGANGAGKSTTINLLLGLIHPTGGEVQLFGSDITPANAYRSHAQVGYAAGDMALFETQTGRQYLDFVMAQTKGDHSERLGQLQQIFAPQLDKKIKTLSRGNKQKVALVAAFVTSPKLVILDEPTSGLDPVMQEAFIKLVHEERERGTTVFMSSHYLQEVVDVCTRVLLMKNGKITHDLTADELRAKGGRTVRLTTAKKPKTLPKTAQDVATLQESEGVKTEFTYGGEVMELLKWLALQQGVQDIEITTQGLETAFLDLYKDEEEQA